MTQTRFCFAGLTPRVVLLHTVNREMCSGQQACDNYTKKVAAELARQRAAKLSQGTVPKTVQKGEGTSFLVHSPLQTISKYVRTSTP